MVWSRFGDNNVFVKSGWNNVVLLSRLVSVVVVLRQWLDVVFAYEHRDLWSHLPTMTLHGLTLLR